MKGFSLKVVTDLMCFCTYFFNLNVVVTTCIVNYRLSQGLVRLPNLTCNTVSQNVLTIETYYFGCPISRAAVSQMLSKRSQTVINSYFTIKTYFRFFLIKNNLLKMNAQVNFLFVFSRVQIKIINL